MLALLSSCKKDTEAAGNGKVQSFTETEISPSGSLTESYTLNYDANGRLTSMVMNGNNGNKFMYGYGSTYTMDVYNNNAVTIHETIYLNAANGFIDSTVQRNNTNDTTTEKLFYNSANLLILKKDYDYSKQTGSVLQNTHTYTYDAAGNRIKETGSGEDITYTYGSQEGTIDLGLPFSGKPNPKLVTKTVYNLGGGFTETFNHTYTIDGSGRVTMAKETPVDPTASTIIKEYNY